jgi:hypothetical protein
LKTSHAAEFDGDVSDGDVSDGDESDGEISSAFYFVIINKKSWFYS